MHGLIFASFSAFIHTRYPDLASAIWESEPRYDSAEAYSDDDFTRVLTRAIERTGDGSRRDPGRVRTVRGPEHILRALPGVLRRERLDPAVSPRCRNPHPRARTRDRPGDGAPATTGEPVGARRVDQLHVGSGTVRSARRARARGSRPLRGDVRDRSGAVHAPRRSGVRLPRGSRRAERFVQPLPA